MPVPVPVRRLLGVAVLLIVVVSLSGCTRVVGPRTWTASAELVNGGTQVVDVRDESGRIDNVEIDPANAPAVSDHVTNPPGQPNVLLVSWTGGACDERTDIRIAPDGTRLAITFRTTVGAGVCDSIGVGHVLRLTSSQPLPPAAVKVATAP